MIRAEQPSGYHQQPESIFGTGKWLNLAEGGVALNDDSRHYISGGIAIYFR